MTVPGRYHTRVGDRIRCDVCPRECMLRPGQRGFCYVRQGTDDGIELTTYGRSSGLVIDPIEKKPLNHFLPGTSVLSFGTAGCNLGCRFCQNWDTSKAKVDDRLQSNASPEAIADAAVRSGSRSVAFTYNDPVIFTEYAIDTAEACRARGVRTVAVTAGYIQGRAREDFFTHIDAVNIDLKAFTETFYAELCFAKLAPVLDTIDYVANHTDTWLELTTLLIPDQNDGVDEIQTMCAWILDTVGPDVPLHFSAFHPDFKLQDQERTPLQTLIRARRVAMDAGIRFVYCGNVHHPASDTTWCPDCGAAVIVRDWYELQAWDLRGGACRGCGAVIPGVFEEKPGTWGRRQRRIEP